MSSSNPAILLGLEGSVGSIENGRRADLIGLDEAGEIRLVMLGGRVVYGT